ncbi:MAG: dual specificity protein phosphatase family protein [bacterium]
MKQFIVLVFVCILSLTTSGDILSPTNRPAAWAKLVLQVGVPNLHKITTNLYRSAQPTAEGMQNLKIMGIKTVLNLRSFNSDSDEVGNTGLIREHIFMKAWHPEREDVVRFLKIVTNEQKYPILFHCQHGADRTGIMCAIYRIAVQGWTKEEAIREMAEGGFGFHTIWVNLPMWLDELNIESIKKEVGISSVK